ncbi:MAG: CoA transferase [Acidimicrobiia bacterium]|nr:CoA transferase [Acidimicrobiia bacterium]
MQPLQGITVLDMTRLLPGAVATMMLRKEGAEIIKVEQPGSGDYSRAMGGIFAATNAGKKSVTLNLKEAAGREAFFRLLESADVVVESFRPGVMERLGLGWEQLSAHKARVIFASLRGFPPQGPLAGMAGHDINYLAEAGILELLGGLPAVQIADICGGSLQLVQSILLALLARRHTGKGSRVEVNMVDGLDPLLLLPRAYPGNPLDGQCPCYRLYTASDGRRIAVGALEPKFWVSLCRALGREDLIAAQFSPDAVPVMEEIFLARTARAWCDYFREHDCCVTPVLPLSVSLPEHREPAPGLGEHNHLLR